MDKVHFMQGDYVEKLCSCNISTLVFTNMKHTLRIIIDSPSYINSTDIPPIMIINRIYETQNLLSLYLVSFLVGLRTYQAPLYIRTIRTNMMHYLL